MWNELEYLPRPSYQRTVAVITTEVVELTYRQLETLLQQDAMVVEEERFHPRGPQGGAYEYSLMLSWQKVLKQHLELKESFQVDTVDHLDGWPVSIAGDDSAFGDSEIGPSFAVTNNLTTKKNKNTK